MADVQIAVIDQQNVQIAVIDPENTQLALAAPAEAAVNVAVPGIQGPVGTTGSVTIAQAGTAATPGIRFESDTNTGIYSPGADQLAVATNGTGRLFIDANGNVGVGTASPLNNAGYGGVTMNGADGAILSMMQGGAETFRVTNATGYSFINTTGATPILFGTAATERLRITSAGNVGIGTSSPATALHVSTASSTAATLTTSGTDVYLRFQNSVNTGGYVGYNSSALTLWTADTERLRIDASGRVGIGTTSPAANLHIEATAAALYIDDPSTVNPLRLTQTGGNAEVVNGAIGDLKIGISNDGNIKFVNTSAETERARIDSSGRILVGTSTARSNFYNASLSTKFQVEGANDNNTRGGSFVYGQSNSSGPLLILGKHRADTLNGTTIVSASDELGSLSFQGSDGTEFVVGAQITAVVEGTPGANDMPGRLVFSTTADGAASPTERLRITSAGVLQVADAGNITVGTTTGTKIGTATTQKIGFYNATPVVQPTAVADATDAATVITQLNALLTRMRNLGLIAT